MSTNVEGQSVSPNDAKPAVSRRALLSLAQEFRDWQREWNLYDIGQRLVKPKNVDDFVSELEQRYVADFKHGG